jgi:GDP-L-fucose synthase
LAGIVLCQAYRKEHQANFLVVIPSNPYGPGDDFSLEDSHVVPALLRKMHEAKEKGDPVVEIWGSGKPKRDFIFSHDLAEACLFLMEKVDSELPINVGSGEGNTIAETALLAKGVVGYEGKLQFNASMPDGMPMKILDSSWINQLGWKAKTPLKEGMKITYEWFLKNKEKLEEKHAVYG